MSEAIRLSLALPGMFFQAVLDPLIGGTWTIIPPIGALFLVAGIVLGVRQREPKLLLFLIPLAVSHVFVVIAASFRGTLIGMQAFTFVMIFLAIELILLVFLVHRLVNARLSAGALSMFALSYALAAAFLGMMGFVGGGLSR